MPSWLLLLVAWAVIVVVNLIPAFMPSSWSVLAAFRIMAGLPLLPLTLGGAAASAVGRTGLALLSRRLERQLPESDRANAAALGDFMTRHEKWRTLLVFGYCLGPFPSNPVFIAAGAGRVPLLPVMLAFFLARAIADTVWVWTTGRLSASLTDLFREQVTRWPVVVAQGVVVVMMVLVFRLPWRRWLGHGARRASGSAGRRLGRVPIAPHPDIPPHQPT